MTEDQEQTEDRNLKYAIRLPPPEGWEVTSTTATSTTLMPTDLRAFAGSGLVPSIVAAASMVEDLTDAVAVGAVVSQQSVGYIASSERSHHVEFRVEVHVASDADGEYCQVRATTRRGRHQVAVVATALHPQMSAISEAVDSLTSGPVEFEPLEAQ